MRKSPQGIAKSPFAAMYNGICMRDIEMESIAKSHELQQAEAMIKKVWAAVDRVHKDVVEQNPDIQHEGYEIDLDFGKISFQMKDDGSVISYAPSQSDIKFESEFRTGYSDEYQHRTFSIQSEGGVVLDGELPHEPGSVEKKYDAMLSALQPEMVVKSGADMEPKLIGEINKDVVLPLLKSAANDHTRVSDSFMKVQSERLASLGNRIDSFKSTASL